MKKAMSEHSKRLKQQKIAKKNCENEAPPPVEQEKPRRRAIGRTSIAAIPPPDPTVPFVRKTEEKKEDEKIVVNENEKLCSELCSSYKFVVNNGVFEQNFEWLPCEVRESFLKAFKAWGAFKVKVLKDELLCLVK